MLNPIVQTVLRIGMMPQLGVILKILHENYPFIFLLLFYNPIVSNSRVSVIYESMKLSSTLCNFHNLN